MNKWITIVFLAITIANIFFSEKLHAQCDSINLELLVLKDIASEVLGQHAYKVHEYTLGLPQPVPDSMIYKNFLGDYVDQTYIDRSFHPQYTKGCDSCRYIIFTEDSLWNVKKFVQRYFKRIIDKDSMLLYTPYPILDFLEQNKPTCWFNVNDLNDDSDTFAFHPRIDSIPWTSYGGNVLLSGFSFSRIYFNSEYSHAVLFVSARISPDFYLVSKHKDGHWHIDKVLNSRIIY